jgi:hypothetical protein
MKYAPTLKKKVFDFRKGIDFMNKYADRIQAIDPFEQGKRIQALTKRASKNLVKELKQNLTELDKEINALKLIRKE